MRILIINENRHNSIGGIEKYTTQIADIFNKYGHTVDEYAFNLNPERIDLFNHHKYINPLNVISKSDLPLNLKEKRKLIKNSVSEIKQIYKNYDLVINQTANVKWFKDFYNSKKVLYIQHFNPNFYKQKYIAGTLLSPIIYLGMWLIGIKNPFKKFQNFVVFSRQDREKLHIKNKKVWEVPLSAFNKNNIKERPTKEREDKLIYFGRIDQYQKNIKKVVNFANKNKIYIDFYGSGNTKLITGKYCEYKGVLKEISDITKYKYSILLSRYEGFSFAVVESLSLGLPVIITNFCPSSKWLVENKGISFSKNINNSIFKNIDYDLLCNECIKFSKKYLSKEKFEENWLSIIKEFQQWYF